MYCLMLSIVIFIALNLINAKLFKKEIYQEAYILNKDIEKGTELTNEYFTKIKIKDGSIDNLDIPIHEIKNYVAKDNYLKDQIINKEMLEIEDVYMKEKSNSEKIYIPIDLKQITQDIDTNKIVSIYYTGRTSQLQEIVKKLNVDNVDTVSSSSITDSYTTFNLIEEARIIDMYDENGNSIKTQKDNTVTSVMVISINVSREMALLINNMKNYGSFSLTIKR